MSPWIIAATVLVLALVPCGIVCARGTPLNRLAGLEAAGSLEVMTFLLLAEGYHRAPFFDPALTLALLTFAGGLVFARFFERWL